MKKQVEISIITGVYNPQPGPLLGAVQSMIRQSCEDWEWILYDDGSNEEYAVLIRRAAALDGRILVFRNSQNHGLAYALNECLRCADGRYIARMDADDLSAPDRLSKQRRFLDNHPQYQWVGSNAELFDGSGVWGFQKMPEIPQRKDFLFNSPYIHPSVMFRKETLLKNGGYRVSPKYRLCEDYELFMRLHRNGGRGYNLQQPLFRYREDYESQKKRNYRRRVRETSLRYHGFRELGILNRNTFPYVLKPLLVGAVPVPVHHYIRRRTKQKKAGDHSMEWGNV